MVDRFGNGASSPHSATTGGFGAPDPQQPFSRSQQPAHPSDAFHRRSSALPSDASSTFSSRPSTMRGAAEGPTFSNHSAMTANRPLQGATGPPNPSAAPPSHASMMRPVSAFQPLDNPDFYSSHAGSGRQGGHASARPPSPQGSTTRSIRPDSQHLTFKSQDLRSALSLQEAHQKKLYMEGYLLKRDDLGTDGKPLHVSDEKRRWTECFVQLSGTILSLWNVDQMQEAALEGREVPPTYINITDSFTDFIGLLSEDPGQVPGSRGKYHHAFALNSAGNNRTLFCFRDPPPFPPDTIERWLAPESRQKPEHRAVIGWLNLGHRYLQAWINAIRLASWEKVRLEEIYTGALIRARLGAVVTPGVSEGQTELGGASASELVIKSPLAKGKMEGWVKARFMGSTEWRKCWLVLTDHKPDESEFGGKKKFWNLGGAGDRSSVMSVSSVSTNSPSATLPGASNPGELPLPPGSNGAPGVANFFDSKKAKKPFASLVYAAHAFAVYPSRPELVEGSSLFKIEGVFPSTTVLSATHRIRTTGWVMLMPELEASAGSKGANAEMMKWVIAFMDSFKLYGRPEGFVWDARNPVSAFFAYPIGPFKDRLFLDRELAEFLEIAREDHLTSRSALHGIMAARMRGERTKVLQPLPPPPTSVAGGPMASEPALDTSNVNRAPELPSLASKLPPLDFGASGTGKGAQLHEAQATPAPVSQSPSTANFGNGISAGFRDNELAEAPGHRAPSPPPMPDSSRPAREARPGFAPSNQPEFVYASPKSTQQPQAQPAVPSPQPSAVHAASRSPEPSQNKAPVITATAVPAAGYKALGSPKIPPKSLARAAEGGYVDPNRERSVRSEVSHHDVAKSPSPIIASSAQSFRSSQQAAQDDRDDRDGRDSQARHSAPTRDAPSNSLQAQPRRPTVPGPSGRGAEQTAAAAREARPDAEPSMAYDESALFYMASISDQLPAPTATSRATLQPRSAAVERQSSQRSAASLRSAFLSESHTSAYGGYDGAAASASATSSEPVEGPATAATVASQPAEDSIGDDALAAYSFLQQPPSPVTKTKSLASNADRTVGQQPAQTAASSNGRQTTAADPSARTPNASFPSSFGQNKRAAERKTAAQLQAQVHQEALSRPGRSGGKKNRGGAHAWGEESSEEDEEEEEEDEDEDEAERAEQDRRTAASGRNASNGETTPAYPQVSAPSSGYGDPVQQGYPAQGYPMQGYPGQGGYPAQGYPTSMMSGYEEPSSRSRSISPGQATTLRAGQAHPALQAAQRQSVFSTHLGAAHGDDSHESTSPQTMNSRDRQTFLQLNPDEQPGAMTTVFTPHGLVQAGAQDKAERSAKKQEADARQTGNHLVNVPNKPPPPQAGLLGAITAHERDRKAAGGYGATLTERERERVSAERRQREEDLLRHQQQQQQMAYYNNPMMMQQMMMSGIMPNMGMGMGGMGMGMPMGGYAGSTMGGQMGGGMGGGMSQIGSMGFDPMMAQQQAMQAAQMAYMNAMSQAHEGSVIGHGSASAAPAWNMAMPMMSPFMMSPRMSMMGQPYPNPAFMTPQPGAPGSEFRGSPPPRPGSTQARAQQGTPGSRYATGTGTGNGNEQHEA